MLVDTVRERDKPIGKKYEENSPLKMQNELVAQWLVEDLTLQLGGDVGKCQKMIHSAYWTEEQRAFSSDVLALCVKENHTFHHKHT